MTSTSTPKVHSLDLIASNLGTPWIRGNEQVGLYPIVTLKKQLPNRILKKNWYKVLSG